MSIKNSLFIKFTSTFLLTLTIIGCGIENYNTDNTTTDHSMMALSIGDSYHVSSNGTPSYYLSVSDDTILGARLSGVTQDNEVCTGFTEMGGGLYSLNNCSSKPTKIIAIGGFIDLNKNTQFDTNEPTQDSMLVVDTSVLSDANFSITPISTLAAYNTANSTTLATKLGFADKASAYRATSANQSMNRLVNAILCAANSSGLDIGALSTDLTNRIFSNNTTGVDNLKTSITALVNAPESQTTYGDAKLKSFLNDSRVQAVMNGTDVMSTMLSKKVPNAKLHISGLVTTSSNGANSVSNATITLSVNGTKVSSGVSDGHGKYTIEVDESKLTRDTNVIINAQTSTLTITSSIPSNTLLDKRINGQVSPNQVAALVMMKELDTTLGNNVYTDLTSAPVGAYVTVYGIDSAVSSWPVYLHGNGKTVVKVPTSAPALTVNGQAIPVTVNVGRVIEATPSDLAAKFNAIQPGDVIYLHAGTYSGKYDTNGWNEANFVLWTSGTEALPMALIAYPGETVTIDNSGASGGNRPNFYLGDAGGGRKGSYFTIAGLKLIATRATIYGGGNTSDSSHPESGAAYVRVVGCTHTITDTITNTGTGLVSIQGDGWKVLGNTFNDQNNREIINNNHAIYIQNGADDVEIAHNQLLNLHMGFTIQIHQDGTPMLYTNVAIHDNLIQGTGIDNMRGINVGRVDPASTISIEHNTLKTVGQGFGAVTVYHGLVSVRNNIFDTINGPAIMANGNDGAGARVITESGNAFTNVSDGSFSAVNGANISDFVHQ